MTLQLSYCWPQDTWAHPKCNPNSKLFVPLLLYMLKIEMDRDRPIKRERQREREERDREHKNAVIWFIAPCSCFLNHEEFHPLLISCKCLLLAFCYLTPSCCIRIYSLDQLFRWNCLTAGWPALIMAKKLLFKLKRIVMQISVLVLASLCSVKMLHGLHANLKLKVDRYADILGSQTQLNITHLLLLAYQSDAHDWHLI